MGDTLGELSAEVEADFARTIGLSKMAELRGLLLELSGTPAREEAKKPPDGNDSALPFRHFADQSQA
jgi:hypothetical protein